MANYLILGCNACPDLIDRFCMHYKGQCFCDSIHFKLKGEPLFTQYCHCNKCRIMARDSQNPKDKIGYNFTAAYLTAYFTISEGLDYLISKLVGASHLYSCGKCNSLIYGISSDPAKQKGIGININNLQFPKGLPSSFKPIRHIWYQDRIADINDELPKFINAPKDQFGTGELFSA